MVIEFEYGNDLYTIEKTWWIENKYCVVVKEYRYLHDWVSPEFDTKEECLLFILKNIGNITLKEI